MNFENYILNKPHIKTKLFNIRNEELWFGNKILFNFEFKLVNYDYLSDNRYDEMMLFSDTFNKKHLNDDELSKLLKNPEYIIYKYENDYSKEKIFYIFP